MFSREKLDQGGNLPATAKDKVIFATLLSGIVRTLTEAGISDFREETPTQKMDRKILKGSLPESLRN